MFWFFEKIYELFVSLLIECVVYILIDVWAKNLLRDSGDDEEKRKIWLWESGIVALAAFILYCTHHTPYILIFLSVCTFLYTQLLGRVNFRYWWRQLATRWDEFEQHEESMEQYAELMQSHHERTQQALSAIPKPAWPQNAGQAYGGFDANSVEPWYPDEATNQAGFAQHMQPNMMPPNITPTSQLRQRFEPNMSQAAPIYSNAIGTMSNRPNTYQPRAPDLMRKPLHSFVASPSHQQARDASTFKNKFLSVLGINAPKLQHPGLPNSGRNVCFMNSVLQCMSHLPALPECLSRDCQTLHCTAAEADLVITASNIFTSLSEQPDHSASRLLNHDALRKAASQLRPALVTPPNHGQQQCQQDCAEFLLWFVDALHTALNACRPRVASTQHQLDNRPKYQNAALEMLKFIYGDLSMQRVDELKLTCKQELSAADGLTSESYAEPLQRLSDLEWLSYKANNNSVLDDLFTGQLVESQRCTQCNKISIQIQTFNILPVPIVEPRQLNGLVYLEDCFTKFGRVEEMMGKEGLRCECCNKRNAVVSDAAGAVLDSSPVFSNGAPSSTHRAAGGAGGVTLMHTVQKRRLLQQQNIDSAMPLTPGASGMSPIASPVAAGNRSIYEFRTSTPIHTSSVPCTLTDGQRRSLLRQLPDCLVVQLMRFTVSRSGDPVKLQTPVAMPLTQLDLSSLLVDQVLERDMGGMHGSQRYDLYGVCVHVGANTLMHGHYMAYVRTRHCGWCKFDDETVIQVNMQYELSTKLLRENAYLLFYRKSASP